MVELAWWKPRFLVGVLAAVGLLAAVACASTDDEEPTATSVSDTTVATPTPAEADLPGPPKYGGILRTYHRRSPLSWRLDRDSAIDQTATVTAVVNNLVQLAHPDYNSIGPDLARSWDVSADGMVYTFYLEPNVINHNGNRWTASDAKFTLENLARATENRPPHPSVTVGGESIFESIETPDDTTLVVRLKAPDGLFLSQLAQVGGVMYTEADYDEMASMDAPSGMTGPYKLTLHLPDEKMEYRRNDDYFKEGLPYLDGIDRFVIKDAGAALAALEARQIDYIPLCCARGMHAGNLQPIADRHPGELTFYPGPHFVGRGVQFNFYADGPWQDKLVRQAINLAIDRDVFCSLIENCTVGTWAGGSTYVSTDRDELAAQFPGFARTGPAKDAEIAEAKRLMEVAGWPDGFEVVAMCRDTTEYRDHNCPAMEFLLRDTLNIRMVLDVQESGAWTEKGRTGDWLMEMGSIGGARIDHPWEWLNDAGMCGQTPRENKRGYCNEEVDELLLQSRVLSDVAALKPLSDQILEIFKEEIPWVPVFWPNRWVVYWDNVHGTAPELASGQYTQALRMEYVWLDQ